jgi:hypothetical protein
MKKCYSVRLKELISISDKCYKAISFDGRESLIPKSQVFGHDYDVQKSDAYWISAWFLGKINIQYSTKKEGWLNPDTGIVKPKINIKIETHIPEKKEPIISSPDKNLIK